MLKSVAKLVAADAAGQHQTPVDIYACMKNKIRQASSVCILVQESEEETEVASDAMSLVRELLGEIDRIAQELTELATSRQGLPMLSGEVFAPLSTSSHGTTAVAG
jgi:hypothetical protein